MLIHHNLNNTLRDRVLHRHQPSVSSSADLAVIDVLRHLPNGLLVAIEDGNIEISRGAAGSGDDAVVADRDEFVMVAVEYVAESLVPMARAVFGAGAFAEIGTDGEIG